MLTVQWKGGYGPRAESADDYLGKPYSPRTLIARHFRRTPAPSMIGAARDCFGSTPPHSSCGEVVYRLTPWVEVLQLLIAHAGRRCHGTAPEARVGPALSDRQLLKQLVHRRQKLGETPAPGGGIETMANVYRCV
jgi:DNA-binding response OmpR family regulator